MNASMCSHFCVPLFFHLHCHGDLQGGLGSALYISGMPGTGKTATVKEVVRVLEVRICVGVSTEQCVKLLQRCHLATDPFPI